MRKLFARLIAVLFVSCGFAFGQDLNDGLVAYYPFNGNANDESGNSLHGVPTNTVLTADRNGTPNSAYQFQPDVDSQIRIADNPLLNFDDQFTVSYWAKFDGTWTYHQESLVYKFQLGSRRGWHFGVDQNDSQNGPQKYRYAFQIGEGGGPIPDSFEILDFASISGWHHVTGVLRNSMIEFYLDGVLVASSPGPATVPNVATDMIFGGAVNPVSGAYQRNLDDIRIYNRGLSGGEVASLYALESGENQFQIVEGNFTWHEAKADAEAKGGRLAVLNTQEKIDAANSYLEGLGFPNAWFGLTDEAEEGNWQWITGEPLTVSYWADGEPNNSFEHYGIYWGGKWNDGRLSHQSPYLLEILGQTPAVPFVALDPLYESPSGEALTIDATPTIGFPTEFTYQWCFNGFKIPANLGGTASSINIDNLTANEGTWSVTVTNSEGIFEQDFEYRLYADSDSDGLSDGYEELISKTDINKPDTDNDGLSDAEEFNVYSTNPNSPDTDSDGFTDLYELETAYDPNSAESVPDALVNIMTAIEVNFNAALGATYAIEFSTDSQNWSVIEDDIVGEGGAVERLYSKTDFPTGFFRVERRDQ